MDIMMRMKEAHPLKRVMKYREIERTRGKPRENGKNNVKKDTRTWTTSK